MSGHNRANASRNCGAERHELICFELLAIIRNNRERQMRIGGHIAVAWKVLCGRKRAVLFDAANELCREIRNLGRFLTERADVNDWIRRIVIYVGIRSENPVYSGR